MTCSRLSILIFHSTTREMSLSDEAFQDPQ